MTYKHFLIGTALCAYILTPIAFIIQKYTQENQSVLTLAQESDRHGNNNEQLELSEVQDAYRRMGISSQALTMDPYQRLVTSGNPTAKNKPFDFRFPTISDLENAIQSYKRLL